MVHVFVAIKILILTKVELHAHPNRTQAEPYT